MNTHTIAGVHTAIPTPFRDGRVDYRALAHLIENQVAGGVRWIVPVGTTGESPTLTGSEHIDVITRAVELVRGRCLVIGGTGSNNTSEAIHYTQEAERAGVDGVLLATPYYNKPNQRGIYAHYRAIAESAPDIFQVLYHIPGRCVVGIDIDTVVRLAQDCPNIVAIKDAGWDIQRIAALRIALDQAGLTDFIILSGDDAMTLDFMRVWASWVVSVASNIIPIQVVNMVDAMSGWRLQEAERIADRYQRVFEHLFIEVNPVPTKESLAMLSPDIYTPDVRLPMVGMTDVNRETLRTTLQNIGIIS